MRESCVKHDMIAQKFNQRNVKVKEVHIAADGASAERCNDLVWSDDESVDEVVDSAQSPTVEEVENKSKASLEK